MEETFTDMTAEQNGVPEAGLNIIRERPILHHLDKALPIGFMHIPKTAGNSFSSLILKASGVRRSNVSYDEHFFPDVDIGAFSPENQSTVYREQSSLEGESLVGGHISLSTFLAAFPGAQLITIMREPVCRLLSNWVFVRTVPDLAYQGWSAEWKARCSLLLGSLKQFLEDPRNAHAVDNLALRMLLRPHPLIPQNNMISDQHDSDLIREAVERLQEFQFIDILENPRLHSNFGAWIGEDLPSYRLNETDLVPRRFIADIGDELTSEVFRLLKVRSRLDLRLWEIVAGQRLTKDERRSLRLRTIRRTIRGYKQLMNDSAKQTPETRASGNFSGAPASSPRPAPALTSPPVTSHGRQTRGLLVTHSGQRCGVWQFGARLHRALVAGGGIDWRYVECADLQDFQSAAAAIRPDVVLANFHPSTLPWAAEGLRYEGAVTFAVFHEASQASVAALRDRPFDVLLCPDPTLLPYDPGALPVPRFMPSPLFDLPPPPEIFTIGSFGFGTPGKGFERLCALVDAQCTEARIRINIPPHDNPAMASPEQVGKIVDACRAAVTRPGIALEITHDFFDDAGLLDFLAANTLNAFLYDDAPGRGISSCTDYALAAGRPTAVTRTSMFRHLIGVNPSICVEDRALTAIAATGPAPLQFHRLAYAEPRAGAAWNATILEALETRRAARAVPDGRGFNKLLDDLARSAYVGALGDLRRLAPEMLARKIERANIQQAFALDAAQRLALRFDAPRILVIGSYEDTACASLRALGYQLDEVDPQVNGCDLEAYYRSSTARAAYEIILCVSVLEHVADDEAFVRQAAALLAPGGIAIFTVDFSERYPQTGLRPAANQRLYTQDDLRTRLMGVLPDCALIDSPSWSDGAEDFEYEGCHYAFASWVFTRLPHALARHAEWAERQLGGAPWKAFAAPDYPHRQREVALREAHVTAVSVLAGKLARAESVIDYVTQRTLVEGILFRPNGRPVKPLRRLLFHTSGKPRRLFKRVVLHKNGTPRQAFARWMQNQSCKVRTTAQQAPSLTAEQDALGGEDRGFGNFVRDLKARLAQLPAPPKLGPKVASPSGPGRRFARRLEKRIVRPVAHRLRNFLTGFDRGRKPNLQMDRPSPPPAPPNDVMSEMRQLAAEMEKALLTLAMERRADAWSAAPPAPSEPSPTPVRLPSVLPASPSAEVQRTSDDLSVATSLKKSGRD